MRREPCSFVSRRIISMRLCRSAEGATAALHEAQRHPDEHRRRDDDDNQDEDTEFDGKDLKRGRGYNAFWISPGYQTFTITQVPEMSGEYIGW